ncbi:tfIIB-brf (nucleomorph) [Hemiselmis andersenii]|uniref:TfIIB-brf n=1 Tax=Hemiselmis andersenii TaxID=464988 RepID=A9BKR9_HEMAN|nr:tfIIB-brf [Hemiselmis andersenii]ABW98074.1 tfIIB-brf [Hemiselmis andersenii]
MKCIKCGGGEINFNFTEGKIICKFCGLLLEENISNPEITFEGKDKKNFSLNGQFVRNSNINSLSYKNKFNDLVLSSAKRRINQISHSLKLKGSFQDEAFKFFILATQRGFINGQKLQNLCVSSLYTVCRQKKTHHLLIDFSDITQIQTNKIGSVFLKFIRDLKINIPVIDPSLYIQRFVSRLQLGNKTKLVSMSALRLIARMKREWVSTGRRPSGLCGAAILLATKMHGLKKTQKEISSIVRIGDFAIRSRLREINKTSMSNLTIKEIDHGGGDDGSGNSLFGFSNLKIHPPSMIKILEKKIFKNSKMKKSNNSIDFDKIPFFPKKKGYELKKKKRKLQKKKENLSVFKEAILYLNSVYETTIKENIWNELNVTYLCSHSIVARAQKEKPFAYFRMNESIGHSTLSKN